MKKGIKKVWIYLSILSFMVAIVFLVLGFNRMTVYDSGESYPYEYRNAYVGGDAYNYIINANYSTAFFVLTATFVMLGIGLIVIGYLAESAHSKNEIGQEKNNQPEIEQSAIDHIKEGHNAKPLEPEKEVVQGAQPILDENHKGEEK